MAARDAGGAQAAKVAEAARHATAEPAATEPAAPAARTPRNGTVLGLSFVVGGIYAVLGELLGTLYTPLVGAGFAGPATLVTLGVLAFAMFTPGLHQKIAAVSGFGSILPFNGFACGIAGAYQGGHAAGGAKGGVKAVWKMFLDNVIIPGAACMVFGVIAALGDVPTVPVPASIPFPAMIPMSFIVGGGLCLLFTVVMLFTKATVPGILLVGLMLGGLCTIFGITDVLTALGGFGFTIMLVGAGQAVTATTMLAVAGNPLMLGVVWGVFVILALIGTASGAANLAFEASRAAEKCENDPSTGTATTA